MFLDINGLKELNLKGGRLILCWTILIFVLI